MAKILKRIDAGALHSVALYDRIHTMDSERVRSEKRKATTAVQARFNKKSSFRKLEYLLAANFPVSGSAIFGTLTYDGYYLPLNRKGAQRQFKYFLQRLREERSAAGLRAPVVFWAPEVLTSVNGRWHFHIVIDNTGRDFDIIRKCWIYGKDIELEKAQMNTEENYEALARYITKESREAQDYDSKPGLHGWSYTRNAKKPQVDSVSVPDDYILELPPGAYEMDKYKIENVWTSCLFVKYIDASACFPQPVKAKRKPKKKG